MKLVIIIQFWLELLMKLTMMSQLDGEKITEVRILNLCPRKEY